MLDYFLSGGLLPTGIPPLRGSLQAALIAGDAINARTVTMQEYHYLLPERTVFYFQGAYLRMKLYIVPSPDSGIIAQLFSKTAFLAVGVILPVFHKKKLQLCNYTN